MLRPPEAFFTPELRRSGAHPKIVSSLLGHARANLAMDVYDQADERNLWEGLVVALCNKKRGDRMNDAKKKKEMVSAEGIEPSTY